MHTPAAIPPPSSLVIERGASLRGFNTFGLPANAKVLVHIASEADVKKVVNDPELGRAPKFILGGGSNLVLTQDVDLCVLKMEIKGRRLLETRDDAWIVEVGAGESWHETVQWCLDQGLPGLENMALIPGTVGAAPVKNIGAY
ncbi:MAG: FAD-binding protein, partial [Aquabacterium sp.]|nr:FAD-binding protein [Aquabacterium sp.]